MEDEAHICCDRCGCDYPANLSMPDPETNLGDFCFECFTVIEYKWDVERGTAWLNLNLPNLDVFMKAYKKYAKGSLDPRKMENNCHAASNALFQLLKKKMTIKLERGHWLGGDVRNDDKSFQQHSWTSVEVPGNNIKFIVDPTQWVFTGMQPELCISNEDDRRYDIGGYRVKQAILGKKIIPERTGKTIKNKLGESDRKWLAHLADRNWDVWTTEEMFVIANMDPRNMSGHAKNIFKAILDCGMAGFIPLEGLTLAGLK